MAQLGNLATSLDDKELKTIAGESYEAYEDDLQSSAEHRNIHADYLDLYHQTHNPATPPWSGASNSSVPLLAEAVNQFQARAYKAFFPSRDFVSAITTDSMEPQAIQAAERVGKYLSYKFTVEDRYYKQDKNSMFQAAALHGCDYTKTYYNPYKGEVCVERVREADLIVPYHAGACRIDDLERKTHVIYMTMNYAAKLVHSKFFTEMPEPYLSNDDVTQETVDKIQGIADVGNSNKRTAKILEQHTYFDFNNDGLSDPCIVWICATSRKTLRIQISYEVDDDGKPTDDKKPIEYFTKYGFIPNSDGFLDWGFGHLIGNLNISVNRMLRQIEDAGTLANVGNMSGFISENLGVKKGETNLTLGSFTSIPKTVSNIRDSIYTMNFPGANQSLVNTFETISQTIQRLGSTTDAVTGNIEKVLQPLSIMTLLESSLQLPTSIMEQMAVSFEDELNKVYKLMRKYTKQPKTFRNGNEISIVRPEDFSMDLRIVPILDPRMITRQQKIAKSQELYNFTMANPMLAQDVGAIREVSRRMLVALDTEEIDKILPLPQEPENIDNQDAENMYYLLPVDKRIHFDVFPEQNHAEHIQKIDYLISQLNGLVPQVPMEDPAIMQVIQGFTNEQKQEILVSLLEHRRKHSAYLYGQSAGVLNGRGTINEMGQPGGNSNGIQGAEGAIQSGGNAQSLPPGSGGAIQRPIGGSGAAGENDTSGILGLANLDIRNNGNA